MANLDLMRLKAGVDCRRLMVLDQGEPAQKAGRSWQWRCCFHPDGSSPSLTGYSDGWYCFGCGKSGDAVEWLRRRRGMGFPAAVRELERIAPAVAIDPAKGRGGTGSRGDDWSIRAEAVVADGVAALWSPSGARALDWLQGRGLTAETIRRAQLGYSAAEAMAQGFSLRRGILLPWVERGRVDAVTIRLPVMVGQRYFRLRGSRAGLFGAEALTGARVAVVCEGELDAMLLSQELEGLGVAVVTPGSAAAAMKPARWLPAFEAVERVVCCFDADNAGKQAGAAWSAADSRVRLIEPPGGANDITDAWRAGADLRGVLAEFLKGVNGNG